MSGNYSVGGEMVFIFSFLHLNLLFSEYMYL